MSKKQKKEYATLNTHSSATTTSDNWSINSSPSKLEIGFLITKKNKEDKWILDKDSKNTSNNCSQKKRKVPKLKMSIGKKGILSGSNEDNESHPLLQSARFNQGRRHIQLPSLKRRDSLELLIDEMFPEN